MTESSCIIIHPQKLHSLFLYNAFVEYFTQLYDNVHLIVKNDPMYLSLYRHKPKIKLRPVSVFDIDPLRDYIYNTLLTELGQCDIYGYEEFDTLRYQENIYYNLHSNLYLSSLFTFNDVLQAYNLDFTNTTLLNEHKDVVNIDRNLNTESYLVSKVQKIAAVPYMVITSDAFKPFVYMKELTSINVHRLLPNVRNFFNLLYFINKAVSVVVSNDILGIMIYYLQTHKNIEGQYLIAPTKRVYFDLNGKRKEEFPFFISPELSSWSFETITGYVDNNVATVPTHYTSIDPYTSLLYIDASDSNAIVISTNNTIESIRDTEDGFLYQNKNTLTYTENGINMMSGGLTYPLPKYDLTLGVDHINLSLYIVMKVIGGFASSRKTLFSYGLIDHDFTLYISTSMDPKIGITMFDAQNGLNSIPYTPNDTVLCYASLSLHNFRLVTQLTLYNINDISQVQNKYYEYNHNNLSNRDANIEIGFESDTTLYHFELLRGVMPDDDKNNKIASLIDKWKTSDSNHTNPNDVDVDVYDEYGVNVEPTLETYDSQYTHNGTQIHIYDYSTQEDSITIEDGIIVNKDTMIKIWVFGVNSDIMYTSGYSNIEEIETFIEQYLEVGIHRGFYDSLSNVYHVFEDVSTTSLNHLTFEQAFDSFSNIEVSSVDTLRNDYHIAVVVKDMDNTYHHKLFGKNELSGVENIVDLSWDPIISSTTIVSNFMSVTEVESESNVVVIHDGYLMSSHNIHKYWVFVVNENEVDLNSVTSDQLKSFMENHLMESSFSNTYHYGENETYVNLSGISFDYAFENLSGNNPVNIDTDTKNYFTVVVAFTTGGKYIANLDQFTKIQKTISVISNNRSENNSISTISSTIEDEMDYEMELFNGDKVYANHLLMNREVSKLFDNSVDGLNYSWIGQSGVMQVVYEFVSGDQYVSQMKFRNPVSVELYFGGNIQIEWWTGHKYTLVTNPSLPGFTNFTAGEEITINFDIVYSSKFKITLYPHENNITEYLGFGEWKILDYVNRIDHVSNYLSWNQ